MPITVKDLRTGTAPRQRNIASLVGGYVIALGCLALFLLVASHLAGGWPGWPTAAMGTVLAAVIGIWIRLADL